MFEVISFVNLGPFHRCAQVPFDFSIKYGIIKIRTKTNLQNENKI